MRHLSTDSTQVGTALSEQGLAGLAEESRRPEKSPAARISDVERQWIAELRARGLGSRRIQSELKRSHDFDVSRPTIEKVLKTMDPRPRLVRPPSRKGSKRYAKEIPGERVQMDTCKIGPGLYQYTAIDDCTRVGVLALYKRRTSANSLQFLELLSKSSRFPFSVYRPTAAESSSRTAFRKS